MSVDSPITLDVASSLVKQLQVAHRLLAGFYGRILPLFDDMAGQLGMDFWYWMPEGNESAPESDKQPSTFSAWNFTPLYASTHAYRRSAGERPGPSDVYCGFLMLIEDSFDEDNRAVGAGSPDPLLMAAGVAVVRAFVYRPKQPSRKHIDTVWDAAPWVETDAGWQDAGEHFRAIAWERPLAEVMVNPQGLVGLMRPHCE